MLFLSEHLCRVRALLRACRSNVPVSVEAEDEAGAFQ